MSTTAPQSSRAGRLGAGIRANAVPLSVVAAAVVAGQLIVLWHGWSPLEQFDSESYIAPALRMWRNEGWTDLYRTPMYPAVLALGFAVAGGEHYGFVVLLQILLTAAVPFETWYLLRRAGAHGGLAVGASVIVALDVWMISWERVVGTETIAYWGLTTTLLLAQRLRLRPAFRPAIVLGVLLGALVLVRPVILPLVVAVPMAALLGHPWKVWRRFAPLAVISGVTPVLLVVVANGVTLDRYTISTAGAKNLFGKVCFDHLYEESAGPEWTDFQEKLRGGPTSPANTGPMCGAGTTDADLQTWFTAHPEVTQEQANDYAVALVKRNPVRYLRDSAANAEALLNLPLLSVDFGTVSTTGPFLGSVGLVLRVAWIFLPATLLVGAWVSRRVPEALVAGLIAASVIAAMALDLYQEFARVRVPYDAVAVCAFALAVSAVVRRASRRPPPRSSDR